MYIVDMYLRVSRNDAWSEGIEHQGGVPGVRSAQDTVRKMLSHPVPPGYRRKRPPHRPKLESYTGVIEGILEDRPERAGDVFMLKKQRHTAKRIFERLKKEHGFDGGYTIVKDYVRERRTVVREMFVPLEHPLHAQCDFGQAWATIGGKKRRVHYFVMSLPHSDGIFIKAYPAETTEAFCDGHVSAFAFLGGVPQRILYDNSKIAVAKILGGGRRKRTSTFTELQSHYLFSDRFGRVGKGNDKGIVEGMVGYGRRNFLVPIPRADSASMSSTRTWRVSAWSVWTPGSGGTPRALASVWSVTSGRCLRCLRFPTTRATSTPHESVRSHWCATAPTTTRCPLHSDTGTCW